MTKEDFKTYIEKQRKELHKEVLYDICLIINNCANCYNEETRETECNCLACVDVYKVNANSFCMEIYDNKTNRKLIDIGEKHNYNVGFVEDKDDVWITFYK